MRKEAKSLRKETPVFILIPIYPFCPAVSPYLSPDAIRPIMFHSYPKSRTYFSGIGLRIRKRLIGLNRMNCQPARSSGFADALAGSNRCLGEPANFRILTLPCTQRTFRHPPGWRMPQHQAMRRHPRRCPASAGITGSVYAFRLLHSGESTTVASRPAASPLPTSGNSTNTRSPSNCWT